MSVEKMRVIVIGLGEVGTGLHELIKQFHKTETLDVEPKQINGPFDVMHICFRFNDKFIDNVLGYVHQFEPRLVIIESTTSPGTTHKIAEKLPEILVCHSPVRGKHKDTILLGLKTYTKYVGPCSKEAAEFAEKYYQDMGLKVYIANSPLETEFAKLMNLSYYGTCVGIFQEFDRIINKYRLNRDDVINFIGSTQTDSKGTVPRPLYHGGYIGGHCVIPALKMLQNFCEFQIFKEVIESNESRLQEVGESWQP